MTDPFSVLGLEPQSSEAEIRARYLELVRQFTPEREPARFAEIRGAYEELRDPVERLQNLLLRPPRTVGHLSEVATDFRRRHVAEARIPVAALLSIAEQMKS